MTTHAPSSFPRFAADVLDAINKGEDKYRVEVLGQKPLLPQDVTAPAIEVEYVPMATGKKRTLHFVLLAGSRWTIRRQAICGTAGNALDMTCLGEDWTRPQILEEYADEPGVCRRCIATLRRIQ